MNKLLDKYKKMPVAAKAAIWFMFCTLLQKCVSFITVPIFTRLMSTEQYGIYSSYLSILNVMTVVCTLNLEQCAYINGFTKTDDEVERERVAVRLLSLSFTITLVAFAIYMVFHRFINGLLQMDTPIVCLMFLEILWIPPLRFWSYKQRFQYKYILLVVVTVSMTVANACLGVVAVLASSAENQALSRVFTIAMVQMVFGLCAYVSYVRRAHKVFAISGWKNAIKLHLPLLPHNLSLSILFSSDRLMIQALVSSTATAIYSVSNSAGQIMQVFKNCIVDAMRPWVYEQIKKKNCKAVQETLNLILLMVAVISFAFSLFAPEIIAIMAPASYYEAIYVIPPIAGSSFFTFLFYVFSMVETYYEKTKNMMYASIIAAGLNLILNYIFIQQFGYMAAAYTTLICYILLSFLHYLNVRKICKENDQGERYFDTRTIVILSVIALILIFLAMVTYAHTVIRYGTIIILVIVAWVKHRSILELIKNFRGAKKTES